MHPHRRRKKRPNYGIRTVEVERGPNGFGFTISGQQPCILSCIVTNSPADQAGLRAGDFLISVNGLSVSKITHDAVVKLIGNSIGPIKMSIAEYYYSDSSDEELDASRIVSNRKPKYMHKPRTHRKVEEKDSPKKPVSKKHEPDASTSTVQMPNEETIEYKALVGYLGTIEMPKQLLPSSRLQTVCSCIRKLRQEKRTPSAVLITVLPSCLSLKNSNNQILAIFPASRVVYISSSADKDSRYFGLVTSAVQQVEVSNSCHVFVTDPKLIDHAVHVKKAENFNITCTPDIITGNCLEFPKNSLYVVSLVQNMYRLQSEVKPQDENVPLVANSPQPSASSNSDSGIGFRDEGAVSDRILVVEFPAPRPQPAPAPPAPRPAAVRGDHDLRHPVLNVRATPTIATNTNTHTEMKPPSGKLHRLTVRAMPDPVLQGDADSGQVFRERAVDVQRPWGWDPAYRTHSCGDLADNSYSQVPKVMSGESASLADLGDCGFGSLAQLAWSPPAALSEPDVRRPRSRSQDLLCEETTPEQNGTSGGAASWAASFEKLLEDPLGVQVFAEFLKKEFSAENIYFWTACERYRRLSAPERPAEAQRIHRRHLCVGAPEPVNVDSHARHYTPQELEHAEPRLFQQAQKQIFNLMKFDSYPRFLKSPVYMGAQDGSMALPALEAALQVAAGSPSKLKKSLSNAEDRRRKSLLPWHRRPRSKSKDREPHCAEPAMPSRGSSMTSLDLAMTCSMQDGTSSKGSADDVSAKASLCRVILSDGATTVVQTRPGETVRQLANRLLDKRGLAYAAYELYLAGQSKPLDLGAPASSLHGLSVSVSPRVVFKLELPNRKVVSVKSKPAKLLADVLRPILHRYGYALPDVRVPVDVACTVQDVDGQRLLITLNHENKTSPSTVESGVKPVAPAQSLDEITNKVFEQLLHEKAETSQQGYDKASVKSEDWGSEHSSGIFRFLRRDSAMHERRKKQQQQQQQQHTHSTAATTVPDAEHAGKKPLIAKLKAGVKVQVATSESDGSFTELYEGLKRAQRCRLEDQRGTEINFELPDFLKDKEGAGGSKQRKLQAGETARFYDAEDAGAKASQPPPLPPKPKVLPAKPSNWGQLKPRSPPALFLDPPTSSFV